MRQVCRGAAVLLVCLSGGATAQGMAGMTMSAPMPMTAAKTVSKAAAASHPRHHASLKPRIATRRPTLTTPVKGSADQPGSATPPESLPGDAAPDGGMAMDMTPDHAVPMKEKPMTAPASVVGNAAAPPPPMDHYADRDFPAAAMEQAGRQMMRQEGGRLFHQLLFNLAEYQVHDGRDGYRWDGEAWLGGDVDRLELRTEGAGTLRGEVEEAEVQALYSRAIGPTFNAQAGVRQDLGSRSARTYATAGVEGLAPYMIQAEARLFLSTRGAMLGRLEAWYDQRLTQRIVLQPRVELNLSAQDSPDRRIGVGLYDADLGLRLRYDVARQFAPYVGIAYQAATGRTADYARADGHRPTTTSLVGGARVWF